VGVPAVDLDRKTAIGPEEVDVVASDVHVHLRLGEAVTAAEPEELRLHLAASTVGVEVWL
jgi:hypothetical protein